MTPPTPAGVRCWWDAYPLPDDQDLQELAGRHALAAVLFQRDVAVDDRALHRMLTDAELNPGSSGYAIERLRVLIEQAERGQDAA